MLFCVCDIQILRVCCSIRNNDRNQKQNKTQPSLVFKIFINLSADTPQRIQITIAVQGRKRLSRQGKGLRPYVILTTLTRPSKLWVSWNSQFRLLNHTQQYCDPEKSLLVRVVLLSSTFIQIDTVLLRIIVSSSLILLLVNQKFMIQVCY